MQQQPLRVLMSRDGTDADHDSIHDVKGVILKEPHVGDSFQIYFDNGKYMRTSTVKRVARTGDELLVATTNSIYRLRPAPANSN